MEIRHKPLTRVENFSITAKFTKKMSDWNHSAQHPKLGPLAARVIGLVCAAFVALADVFIHVALMLAKCVAAVSVLPFRLCIRFNRDFDLSSPLVHLIKTVHSLFNVAILPLLCFGSPDRAYLLTQPNSSIEDQKKLIKEHEKYTQLNLDYNTRVNDIEKINNDLKIAEERIVAEKAQKEQEIEELKGKKKNLEEQIEAIKNGLPQDQLNAIRALVEVESQEVINGLNNQIQNLNQQIAAANLSIENAQREIDPLKYQIAALENQKANLNKEIEERDRKQKEEIDELKKKHEESTQDADKSKRRTQVFAQQYSKLKNTYDEQTKELEKLKEEFEDQKYLLGLKEENKKKKEKNTGDQIPPLPEKPTKGIDFKIEDLPPPPPPPPNVDQKEEEKPEDPLDEVINYLNSQEDIQNAKEDLDWLNKDEGKQILAEAHQNLMDAIKNFDGFKEKDDPIRKVDKVGLGLAQKHRTRVDALFNRGGRQGLIDMSRHLKDLSEFFEDCIEKKNLDLKRLNESVFDVGGSILRDLKHEANLDEALRKKIDYIGMYLQYLEPKLKHLVDEHKAKKAGEEKIIEDQKKAAELEKKDEKRKELKLLTKEEALAPLVLKPRKKHDADNVDGFDVLGEIRKSMIKMANVVPKIETMSVRTIKDIDQFEKKLMDLIDSINECKEEYYQPTPMYGMMKKIVEWLNDRKNYEPAAVRITKVEKNL